MTVFFVNVIISRQSADGDKAFRADVIQHDEQSEAGNAVDGRLEPFADAVGQISGQIAFFGVAFRGGGAPTILLKCRL